MLLEYGGQAFLFAHESCRLFPTAINHFDEWNSFTSHLILRCRRYFFNSRGNALGVYREEGKKFFEKSLENLSEI